MASIGHVLVGAAAAKAHRAGQRTRWPPLPGETVKWDGNDWFLARGAALQPNQQAEAMADWVAMRPPTTESKPTAAKTSARRRQAAGWTHPARPVL